MKRSILLALAIGISSCSSRSHDIMSNRTFSMTCDAAEEHTEFPSPHIVAIVNLSYHKLWEDPEKIFGRKR